MSLSRAYLAKKLARPLPTKDGGTLQTIAEARAYMQARPQQASRPPTKGVAP
jgi:hypothetical protein